MSPPPHATIAAISSGPAPGGIGVIRLSGPRALEAARAVAPALSSPPEPRRALFTEFVDVDGAPVDRGVVLFFQAPHSSTGEDVVELHAHGSPRLLALLLERLVSQPGVRGAEPGEFTRRAYLNGKLELSEAEAVADLIAAQSEAAVKSAARQLHGEMHTRIQATRARLVDTLADAEAALDFPDESDQEVATVVERVKETLKEVNTLIGAAVEATRARAVPRVVLVGPVNAGKSTLFNRLAGEARALVDQAPGTTRDGLEARLEWFGQAISLWDTAGLRESPGRVEAMGIERTQALVRGADVAIVVSVPGEAQVGDRGAVDAGAVLRVLGKSDVAAATEAQGLLRVSGKTGEGVEALKRATLECFAAQAPEALAGANSRQLEALRRASQALENARVASEKSTLEVVAGELRFAIEALGELTGENASTDLLDAIFRRFCIGK